MLDAQQQARFARGCTTAAFDYAAAASQAYFEGTHRLVTMWADAFAAAAPDAEPRSWYRPPADAGVTARHPSDNWAKPSQAWFPTAPRSASAPAATAAPMLTAQLDAWQAMMTAPLTLTPSAWPMAYWMMSGGMPKSVAWPMARGHAAAADAAMAATEAASTVFSSYRSEGGHAAAQIVMLPLQQSGALLANNPWLALFGLSTGR